MLTDAALKALRPADKLYKVTDRDGMYAAVATSGTISFRYDYRLNGRRESVTFGKYGPGGLSLARAREMCIDARRAVAEGHSPAIEKQRQKRRIKEAASFGQFGERWLTGAQMADSTKAMRRTIFQRDILPYWKNRLLTEISPDDLRGLCADIVKRGATGDRHPCPRYREADLRLCDSARRESAQSGRRCRPRLHCNLYGA
jgi:hypothetical protein